MPGNYRRFAKGTVRCVGGFVLRTVVFASIFKIIMAESAAIADGSYGSSSGVNNTSPSVSPWAPTSQQPVTGPMQQAVPSPSAPPLPKYDGSGGSGKTATDTAAMRTFAANVGMLSNTVESTRNMLQASLPAAAGGFYQGQQIEQKINGNGSTDGLLNGYYQVMVSTLNTLLDLQSAVTKLAADFEHGEDSNSGSATTLNDSLSQVATDINSIATAGKALPSSP